MFGSGLGLLDRGDEVLESLREADLAIRIVSSIVFIGLTKRVCIYIYIHTHVYNKYSKV